MIAFGARYLRALIVLTTSCNKAMPQAAAMLVNNTKNDDCSDQRLIESVPRTVHQREFPLRPALPILGKQMVNVVPLPSSLTNEMRPFNNSTYRFTMFNPRPVPLG